MYKVTKILEIIHEETVNLTGEEMFELSAGILGAAMFKTKNNDGAKVAYNLMTIIQNMARDFGTDLFGESHDFFLVF